MNYKNPTPVAVALVLVQTSDTTHGLLAIRRANHPHIGGVAFPGGYVEEGESAEEAAARELMEETGIQFNANEFRPVRTATNSKNNMLIFCMAHHFITKELFEQIKAGFVANSEVSEIMVVNKGDDLCFPLHKDLLDSNLW